LVVIKVLLYIYSLCLHIISASELVSSLVHVAPTWQKKMLWCHLTFLRKVKKNWNWIHQSWTQRTPNLG